MLEAAVQVVKTWRLIYTEPFESTRFFGQEE
jgi:hypothetical protein